MEFTEYIYAQSIMDAYEKISNGFGQYSISLAESVPHTENEVLYKITIERIKK